MKAEPAQASVAHDDGGGAASGHAELAIEEQHRAVEHTPFEVEDSLDDCAVYSNPRGGGFVPEHPIDQGGAQYASPNPASSTPRAAVRLQCFDQPALVWSERAFVQL